MNLEQWYYSTIKRTFHMHNAKKELLELEKFLQENNVKVDSAIDIACGDGEVTAKLREILKVNEIYGNDLNGNLLKRARKNNIKTIQGDMNYFKTDEKFDISIIFGSFHHSTEKEKTIEQLKKLSSKYVLIVDLTVRDNSWHRFTNNKYYRFDATRDRIWSVAQITAALEDNDCKCIATKTFKNANYFHDRSFVLACKNS